MNATLAIGLTLAVSACIGQAGATEAVSEIEAGIVHVNVAHQLPPPTVRLQARISEGWSAVKQVPALNLLTPFLVPPYDNFIRYKTLTYANATGSSMVTFTLDPFGNYDWPTFWNGWRATVSGAHTESEIKGRAVAWSLTVDPYYNPGLYTNATSLSPTSATVPYIEWHVDPPTWATETWTLSDPVPPLAVATGDSSPWSEWSDEAPVAWQSSGSSTNSRQDAEYRLVASEALRGKTVRWLEIFTPHGLPAGAEYTPRSWTVDGRESPVYPLKPTRDGSFKVMLLTGELAVDANRDGRIMLLPEDASDATSAERPYRLWINDDKSSGDTGGDSIPGQTLDPDWDTPATYYNRDGLVPSGFVHGARDLVDYFPVYLDIKDLLTELPPSDSTKYSLRQSDGAVNVVFTNLTRTHAFDCLRPPADSPPVTGGFGPALTAAPGAAIKLKVTASGTALPEAFLDCIRLNDGGVILVDGRAATTNPLILTAEKNGSVVAELKLDLRISPVEAMFRHLNLRDLGIIGLVGSKVDSARPTTLDDPVEFPDAHNSDGRWLIFLHGYNVSGNKARGWQSEMFKRLYWSGSRARFVGVSWFGDPDDGFGPLPADYHLAVRNALATAPAFAQAINALSGDKSVLAHSLGCCLVASAMAEHGLNATTTCFVNAALARECFDGEIVADASGMTPDAWRAYDARLYAANWSRLFPSTDGRSGLTWRSRFREAAGATYNFYSSTEDVLAEYTGEVPETLFEAAWTSGAAGAFTWVFQEKAKGFRKDYLFGLIAAGSTYMGWGMNIKDPLLSGDPVYWKWVESAGYIGRRVKTTDEIGPVSEAILRRHPVFEPGWGEIGGSTQENPISNVSPVPGAPAWIFDLYGASSASSLAAAPLNRGQLLAEAIPALSWPAGSHAVDAFEARNHDSAIEFADRISWPRGLKENTTTPDWRHSDVREVAYPFLYGLFDEIVTHSAL